MTRLHLALLLTMAASCTETIQLGHDPLANLVAIDVLPGDATITITDLAPPHHTLQYQAMGRFADGSTRDVTSLVVWTLDNHLLGSFDQHGLFVASHGAAGRAEIRASGHDVTSGGALTVMIDATVVDPTFPPPSANLFDPANPVVAGDPTNAPSLIYPSDGTRFPHAVSRTLFQFAPGANNDAFRLSFDSELLHLVVETGADRWAADGAMQRLLAGSGLAGPLRVEIRGTSSAGTGTVYAGPSVTLSFSPDTPGGPIYFWSAATNGIMRGGIDSTSASKLYPGNDTCVGCHALARDGSAMAMGYDNGFSFDLQAIDLATTTTTISASASRPMGWATYSPDGTQLVVANNGILTHYDARTGAPLGTLPLPNGARYATHPDWSPGGDYLAVALTNQRPNNLDVKAASIARIPFNAGAWGTPEVLVDGAPTNNNYFPKWSPDGRFIAYVRASGSSQGAASAVLVLVAASGGTPRVLTAASHRIAGVDVADLANTMPSWAPRIDDRAWLAFVSSRPYGSVLPEPRGQVWITALDLESTGDPSSAAFWLPCQDVTVLNNNPAWSAAVSTQ